MTVGEGHAVTTFDFQSHLFSVSVRHCAEMIVFVYNFCLLNCFVLCNAFEYCCCLA